MRRLGRTSIPPILLLTGQLLTEDFWAPLKAALPGRTFVHPDNGADDTIAGMARRALAATTGPFSIVAHAMGGFTAFEILRQAPERVADVALLGTLAPNDTPVQTERRLGYARLVEEGKFEQVVEERVPILLAPAHRSDAALLAQVRAMAAATGAARFLKQQAAIMSRADSRPHLAAINAPTLIVWGREDGIVTLAHQEEMRDGIAGARLQIIEVCGHLGTLEQPERTIAALKDWLTR
ncbi:MAG: alpha/beta hydrolase [Hyphomonadaceae bacterium]|nr:alpha/beta hydrolase [Hyphomonadaceae bacterium]